MISVLKAIRPQNSHFVLKISVLKISSSKNRTNNSASFLGKTLRPKLCLQAETIRPIMLFRPPDVLPQRVTSHVVT